MGSAMTTPARVGQIKMRTPEVRPLVGVRDVQGEARLGLQKARTTQQIGQSVTKIAEVSLDIKAGNQMQASHAAVGRYNAQMSAYQVQLEKDKFLIDEATGKKNFEVMPEKMADYEKSLKQQLTDEYGLTMRDAVANWSIKTDAAKSAYMNSAQVFHNKETITQSVELAKYALSTTFDPNEASAIIGDMAADGLINPEFASSMYEAWEVGFSYKTSIKTMPTATMEQAISAGREALNAEGDTKLMSEAQRNKIVSESQSRVASIHLSNLRQIQTGKGSEVALRELNALMDGGPEVSGAIDEQTHNAMMGTLNASLNRQIALDKELYDSQVSSNFFGAYANPNPTYSDVLRMAIWLDDADNRALVDERTKAYATLPTNQFYNSPEVDALLQNGARVDYHGEGMVTRLETDINNGVLRAIDKVEEIESIVPRSIPLNDRARSRMEFTKNRHNLGMASDDPVKEQQDFAAIENRGPEQKARDLKVAAANLENIESPSEAYTRTAGDLGYTDDDFFNPDAVRPGTEAEIDWKDAYAYILPSVDMNHERAARYATTSISTIHGATTAYESNEPVTEKNAPESVQPAPGFKSGQPNPYYDKQYHEHIDKYNAENDTSYKPDELRREYYGKDDEGKPKWIYYDMNDIPITKENGKVPLWGYHKEDPKVVKEHTDLSLNRRAEFFLYHQESVAADSPLSLMEFADVDRDPVTGRIDPTATGATNLNAKRWKDVKPQGRDFVNEMYAEAYNTLLQENAALSRDQEVNQEEIETGIHLYLNSRGYMRGDVDGNFIRPPGY